MVQVIFVIAGDGELYPDLTKRVATDHLNKKVILTGNLTPQEVRDLLRITDVFVYPSHHNEGFPNSILEAGASGCFVIVTDNAGTSEIVANNLTGSFIKQKSSAEIGQTLTWALDNHKKTQKMGMKLREEIKKKFNWIKIAEVFYKVLSSS